jgi:ribonuclease VapC
MVVLDSSALLASLLDEPGKERVDAVIGDAIMSVVNLAEVVGYFSKEGLTPPDIDNILASVPLTYIVPDVALSIAAGNLRGPTVKAGLSLGDRFCLALAAQKGLAAVTSDRKWAGVSERIGVVVELIR